jgi:hypothetical protein
MTSQPTTNNPLLVNYFQFVMDKVPNIVYFCQTVNLPGIGFGAAEQPTTLGHPVKIPTGSYRFQDLELTFKVDENLVNWLELYEWVRLAGNYTTAEGTNLYKDKTSSATLLITNSVYKPKIKISFKHVFPTAISGIKFSVVQQSSTEAIATVKFAHTGYDIIRLENV